MPGKWESIFINGGEVKHRRTRRGNTKIKCDTPAARIRMKVYGNASQMLKPIRAIIETSYKLRGYYIKDGK